MLNNYSFVGEVTESPAPLNNGAYSKLRLRLDNAKSNRSEFVEVVGKAENMSNQLQPGCIVAVSGQVGGKINDKGYFNISLWANTISLVHSPIRQHYQRPDPAPRPPKPTYEEVNDDDIPF